MNLPKVFDCLLQGFLVAKLHAYGLSETACETMFDYLQDCKLSIKIFELLQL